MQTIVQHVLESIRQGQAVALAMVIARKGSLPMAKRAKLLVCADGNTLGTIGGGKLEADVIQAAQHVLRTRASRVMAFDLTADQIEDEGLTCGGTVDIFIEYVQPGISEPVVQAMLAAVTQQRPAVILTLVNAVPPRKLLIRTDGGRQGTTGDTDLDEHLVQLASARIGQDCLDLLTIEVSTQCANALGLSVNTALQIFLETLVPTPTVYLFGGGHISLHLSRLLPSLNFEFVVVDDRQDFANPQRFPQAKACVVHEFATVFEKLTFEPHCAYVVIATRGHQSDFVVLEQALHTDARYIGMIGSHRKIQIFFEQLQQRGITAQQIARIHAPIGIAINADTPEEIAISIAAELIHVRRNTK